MKELFYTKKLFLQGDVQPMVEHLLIIQRENNWLLARALFEHDDHGTTKLPVGLLQVWNQVSN
jgi:hypothetical protein